MGKKLRLLITKECNRNCAGCCNKDWDLDSLPIINSYKGFKLIMLTGGEPMLKPLGIVDVIGEIKEQNKEAKIILYTAKIDEIGKIVGLLCFLDGITITLHEQADVADFVAFYDFMIMYENQLSLKDKSLRLNVFAGIDMTGVDTSGFIVKDNIEWIENCPLPEDEVFGRIRDIL